MANMLVTLDVSRSSGWLNADACYRVETGAMRRGEVQARGRERGVWGGGGASSVQGKAREYIGRKLGTRGAPET